MRIFIAGVMQGTRQGRGMASQDYRTTIADVLTAQLGKVEIWDPNQLHPEGQAYGVDRAKRTFVEMSELAVNIRRRATRVRREWVRVATVRNGRLTFEMTPFPVSSKYDELMVVAAEDFGSLDSVEERVRTERLSLEDVVSEVFPELAKLSPQGTVHTASLYSVINIAVRVPPGPVLNVLRDRFELIGDNYWVARGRASNF